MNDNPTLSIATSRSTSAGRAPSAIRMPISRPRRRNYQCGKFSISQVLGFAGPLMGEFSSPAGNPRQTLGIRIAVSADSLLRTESRMAQSRQSLQSDTSHKLVVNCAGARSAGNLHAACDVAGDGDGATANPKRARRGKPRTQAKEEPYGTTAPALDPTYRCENSK